MMNINGKITLSIRDEKAVLRVMDADSRQDVLQIYLTPYQFLQLTTGLCYVECTVDIKENNQNLEQWKTRKNY